LRSKRPRPNCGGDKTPQRAKSPDGVLRSLAALRRRTVTVCYVPYCGVKTHFLQNDIQMLFSETKQ